MNLVRKCINLYSLESIQVIAEETNTKQKLSSTSTLTITVTDANDNRPKFEHETYSYSVSETAPANHLIGTITAKDLDSGRFGSNGIRYSLSGDGSHSFNINEKTGALTVAECEKPQTHHDDNAQRIRKKRQTNEPIKQSAVANAKRVNLTITGETGVIDVVDDTSSTTEFYFPYTNGDSDVTFRPYFSIDDDYMVMSDDSDEETTTTHEFNTFDESHTNELNAFNELPKAVVAAMTTTVATNRSQILPTTDGPGHPPCLDHETQSVYYLSLKVRQL